MSSRKTFDKQARCQDLPTSVEGLLLFLSTSAKHTHDSNSNAGTGNTFFTWNLPT